MTALPAWFSVHFNERVITLAVNPPNASAWQASLLWGRIIRVCFQAGDWLEPDVIYIFTDERPESYMIPVEADGGQALWEEILKRNLFDAEMAITAAMATNELFCSPLHSPRNAVDALPLMSPEQLPDLEGETLILTWDQLDADSLILQGEKVIWREWTGWEVYERFEEIALIFKQKYGKRLKDIIPTPRSCYALYGDSTAAFFRVAHAREAFGKE